MDKFCEICNNPLNQDFEFCPYCSNPISEKAKKLENDKSINAQLMILASLVREVEDPKTLYTLDKLIKSLGKK